MGGVTEGRADRRGALPRGENTISGRGMSFPDLVYETLPLLSHTITAEEP